MNLNVPGAANTFQIPPAHERANSQMNNTEYKQNMATSQRKEFASSGVLQDAHSKGMTES